MNPMRFKINASLLQCFYLKSGPIRAREIIYDQSSLLPNISHFTHLPHISKIFEFEIQDAVSSIKAVESFINAKISKRSFKGYDKFHARHEDKKKASTVKGN